MPLKVLGRQSAARKAAQKSFVRLPIWHTLIVMLLPATANSGKAENQ
jgi:hypothetical protein